MANPNIKIKRVMNTNIESFRYRASLPEIEIQDIQRKRNGNTLSPRSEKKQKLRITSKNYQKTKRRKIKRKIQQEPRRKRRSFRSKTST